MLYIGKYTGTHGLKGEIKILSDFSRKDLIFKKGFKIYIKDKEYVILEHRPHKTYNMVTLESINDIKDIIGLRGESVYINEKDLNNDFLEEDLINDYCIKVKDKNYKIKSIIRNGNQTILKLENNKMIPFVEAFIKDIDSDNKIICMDIPEGLL